MDRSAQAATVATAQGSHFSCSLTAVLLARVEAFGGDEALRELLARAGSERTPEFLRDIGNWVSFDEALALWRAGARVTHHPQFARAVGEDAARRLNGSPVAALFRSLGSPGEVYRQLAVGSTKFSTVSRLETVAVGEGFAEILATALPGFPRVAEHCEWTCGLLTQAPVLFGLAPARVEHERCAALGAESCRYRVLWSAPAQDGVSSGEDVEGTSRQLQAMRERLRSMFATASDLIGSDDIAEVLARISDRAAVEVRAPRCLLAVRTTPDGPLHLHHKGYDEEQARLCAERLLHDDPASLPDSWLVAEVRSNRRDYGRLLAKYDAGLRFFPEERELFEVYARYAASALDGAAALADAKFQADHDALTGLYNRRRFSEELERALRHASRHGRSGALMMLDLDDFKLVNDSHGHATGDAALKAFAQAIAGRVRDSDVAARLGGDEFAIVLAETDERGARAVGEDIRAALAARMIDPPLHISGGIVVFDAEHPLRAGDALIAADVALYEAKEAGKDQIRAYSGRAGATVTWVGRIRSALEEERFVLYSQPMLDLATGEVSHHELLLRMISEEGQLIAPGDFLPAAERFGLTAEIDRWVTREGLRLAGGGRRVSINLSAQSIGDGPILEMVTRACAGGRLDPACVIFEITESAAMTNMQSAREFVQALSALGCHVALDDFGTGFASFTHLKHLPASYLKIDMEFVRDMLSNPTDRHVVDSITQVAHSLGKRAVAEGVEDAATLRALREGGVDWAQGFFIARPQRISPPTPVERAAALPRPARSRAAA